MELSVWLTVVDVLYQIIYQIEIQINELAVILVVGNTRFLKIIKLMKN
jgi:hypothetical protein